MLQSSVLRGPTCCSAERGWFELRVLQDLLCRLMVEMTRGEPFAWGASSSKQSS